MESYEFPWKRHPRWLAMMMSKEVAAIWGHEDLERPSGSAAAEVRGEAVANGVQSRGEQRRGSAVKFKC